MGNKGTTQGFIIKARTVHGDKYDYSRVVYVHSQLKVEIICKEHGLFLQSPQTHLSGSGCRKCGAINISIKRKSCIGQPKICPRCKRSFIFNQDNFSIDNSKPLGIGCYCKKCNLERGEEWKEKHPEETKAMQSKCHQKRREIGKHQEYVRNKKKNDKAFIVINNFRNRLRTAIHGSGGVKNFSSFKLCGCSREFLLFYLESQFTDGMSWDNYGKWHIDHILPIKAFNLKDPIHQKACAHYSNLRPLWASQNYRKSASYNKDDFNRYLSLFLDVSNQEKPC